jgi:SNF2 family DNA or RNA helicase
MTRLKQFANGYGTLVPGRDGGKKFAPAFPSNKFDALVEMLEERGITGVEETEEGEGKVVIASQFTEVINLFATELRRKGIQVLLLTGKQSDREREESVKRFQKPGGPRVFMINTMAGGVSVTLDAADDLIFIDETFVPDDQEQVEDRTHRTSRVHNVTIYYLRTRGTIDETIARNNIEKDDIQKRLLDGKRGVELARRLIGVEA